MLVLASNSPRRKELLALGGWDFIVAASQVDESVLPGETPQNYVQRLAEMKAFSTLALLREKAARDQRLNELDLQQTIILAADTTVVDLVQSGDGDISGGTYEILGKPADAAEAESMLRRLRNRMHQVFTGLAVLRVADQELYSEVVETDVWMRAYSDEEMQAYIASADPLDKAGAYAIQHSLFRPVQNLQGCYANVMGLPVCHAGRLLAQLDCPPATDILQGCQQALNFKCPVFIKIMA
jgi:septum formation protein